MGSPTKEKRMLELFFNEPSKHWHFEDIVKIANISRQQANKWLKRMLAEKLILRIKPKGKMPYFVANFSEPNYMNRKSMFALEQLNSSGLLKYLQNNDSVETAIIFGSFSRSDWHTESDIDLFLYGNPRKHDLFPFQRKLGREIETWIYKSDADLDEIQSGLLWNVADGLLVKGSARRIISGIHRKIAKNPG